MKTEKRLEASRKYNSSPQGKEHNRAYRVIHKEHTQEYLKKYYDAHKDHETIHYENQAERAVQCETRWHLLKRYGLTPELYQQLFDAQGGCCAICGRHQLEIKRALGVDHNHITGKVRGLLCNKCNMAAGLMGDSAEKVHQLGDYLSLWEGA